MLEVVDCLQTNHVGKVSACLLTILGAHFRILILVFILSSMTFVLKSKHLRNLLMVAVFFGVCMGRHIRVLVYYFELRRSFIYFKVCLTRALILQLIFIVTSERFFVLTVNKGSILINGFCLSVADLVTTLISVNCLHILVPTLILASRRTNIHKPVTFIYLA